MKFVTELFHFTHQLFYYTVLIQNISECLNKTSYRNVLFRCFVRSPPSPLPTLVIAMCFPSTLQVHIISACHSFLVPILFSHSLPSLPLAAFRSVFLPGFWPRHISQVVCCYLCYIFSNTRRRMKNICTASRVCCTYV